MSLDFESVCFFQHSVHIVVEVIVAVAASAVCFFESQVHQIVVEVVVAGAVSSAVGNLSQLL